MKTSIYRLGIVAVVLSVPAGAAFGWGRGGFHGGGGGFHAGGFGGYREGGFDRGSFSGSRNFSGWEGAGRAGGMGSYNRSWSGDRGGSVDVSGSRGAVVGPRGAAAGSTRDVSATGPGGRTYSSSSQRGAAVGPGGAVAGGSRAAVATGPAGAVAGGSRWGAAAGRFPTDAGFARYSTAGVSRFTHPTAYWSNSYVTARAGYVRTGWGYYGAFRPTWYTAHPGAWAAAGWAAGAAWSAATWPALVTYLGVPAVPIVYNYGDTVVYQGDQVYNDGENIGSAQQYAQQASTLAQQGQEAPAPPADKWQALGVFALVQGEDKNSNTMFQLAVNPAGIIRGNYYDGLMDSTTPVYGSVNKKTQRAAWTVGEKKTPVFEAGIFNLTKDETPVLVHFGPDKTQQWLLVRMDQKDAAASDQPAPATGPAPAQVIVTVPADADVFFDGSATTETGTERVFTTPALAAGQKFYYDIEAQWTADGQPVERSHKVLVTAGATVRVDLTAAQ
jgi:uncharacterized protein (TIGR03000 family)